MELAQGNFEVAGLDELEELIAAAISLRRLLLSFLGLTAMLDDHPQISRPRFFLRAIDNLGSCLFYQ